MTHPHIVLHGNNFDSNRGCQALRLSTQMILDRYLPDYPRLYANIFCNDDPQFITNEPDAKSAGQIWETRRQGTPAFYLWGTRIVCSRFLGRFPAMKAHRALDNAAALLALGGDNLSYDYGFLATLLFFSPLQAAIRKGVPTVVWGASIGPFSKRPRWERRFADLLRRVDLITVREPITQEYLEGLGVRDNIRRAADPAFLLPVCPVELPHEIEQALQAGALGVNLAPLMKRYNNLSSGAWMRQAMDMLAAIRRITRSSHRLDTPCHDVAANLSRQRRLPIHANPARCAAGGEEKGHFPLRRPAPLQQANQMGNLPAEGFCRLAPAFHHRRPVVVRPRVLHRAQHQIPGNFSRYFRT